MERIVICNWHDVSSTQIGCDLHPDLCTCCCNGCSSFDSWKWKNTKQRPWKQQVSITGPAELCSPRVWMQPGGVAHAWPAYDRLHMLCAWKCFTLATGTPQLHNAKEKQKWMLCALFMPRLTRRTMMQNGTFKLDISQEQIRKRKRDCSVHICIYYCLVSLPSQSLKGDSSWACEAFLDKSYSSSLPILVPGKLSSSAWIRSDVQRRRRSSWHNETRTMYSSAVAL